MIIGAHSDGPSIYSPRIEPITSVITRGAFGPELENHSAVILLPDHWSGVSAIGFLIVFMIHNPTPEFSLFDEALLSCADGHCLFDSHGKLLSYSGTFKDFYPKLRHHIQPGYEYRQFIRDLMEYQVIKNLKPVEDIDQWVEKQVEHIGENPEFIHHLHDGRYVKIKHTRLSNGYWFFAASDITNSVTQRSELEESNKRFESFTQVSSDWLWELDSNLCYIYFSGNCSPIGNISTADIIGRSRIDHITYSAEDNLQRREHNDALLSHEKVETVLTSTLDGEQIHIRIQAAPKFDNRGNFNGYMGCAKNITTEYGLKKKLEFQASHDELTGLVNRRAFGNYLNISLQNYAENDAQNNSDEDLHQTLIFIDLDQFKMVNDNAGHQAGDQLLSDVTQIFSKVYCCANDVVARLGGDEFAILSSCNEEQAKEQTDEFIRLIGDYRFSWAKRTFTIGASAGIVAIDSNSTDDSELLSKADTACYSAKMSGRNQAHLYSDHSTFECNQNDEIGKLELINDSLLHDRLSLALQPIVPTGPMRDHSKYEVLLRLKDATREIVPPGLVIPVAEKYDRMQHLDLWVVEHSILGLQQFSDVGQSVALSVNLSGNTLSNESCLNRIARLVEHHNVQPRSICFEITETATIKRIEKACNFISHLKNLGCEFSLDDFGSGLSSFSYLRSLPVDYLKIDGCFVTNILDDSANRAIVTSFNTLAHEMGMRTVAEYVETEEIADALAAIGIDYLQGFGVGKPQNLDEWLAFFRDQQRETGT